MTTLRETIEAEISTTETAALAAAHAASAKLSALKAHLVSEEPAVKQFLDTEWDKAKTLMSSLVANLGL